MRNRLLCLACALLASSLSSFCQAPPHVQSASVNGVIDASSCGEYTGTYPTKPSWCPSAGDVGAWINGAIAHLPKNPNGCPYGTITVDPMPTTGVVTGTGIYSDATTIIKPRMVAIDWNNAYVNWTPTSGMFEYIGDACRGAARPIFIRGHLIRRRLLH
jgi:hypothetical protein